MAALTAGALTEVEQLQGDTPIINSYDDTISPTGGDPSDGKERNYG
ncbi:MAG: hypothetical protein HY320_00635 [Armatimonadetes bacterium]|nr:hypothetical protein [Armatimonadota bacterium]